MSTKYRCEDVTSKTRKLSEIEILKSKVETPEKNMQVQW